MTFYRLNPTMKAQLESLLDQLEKDGRTGLKNTLAITWVSYDQTNPKPQNGSGTNWAGTEPFYPASVVKIIYALAIEAWIQKDILTDTSELRRAMKDMIAQSSNDATSLLLDLLTGTTSGPSLRGENWEIWKEQRQLVNHWLRDFAWEELSKANCCQKTWAEGPFGREKDFYQTNSRNALSTEAIARFLEGIMTSSLISPPACKRLRELLSRSIDPLIRKEDPENQVDSFLGEGYPPGTKLWSKAGWMSQARHDAAWCCTPNSNPMLLVVFTKGPTRSNDKFLLPTLAKELLKFHEQGNPK